MAEEPTAADLSAAAGQAALPGPKLNLYLIAYNEEVKASVGPGWLVLDNLDNPRPDWFEYWPIRQFLKTQVLDEDAHYGFFSPKFTFKTQLTHEQVLRFIQADEDGADVHLFSPQPDMGAFFLNVFEQGETFDAGFIDAYEAFLRRVERWYPLRSLVMDSRTTCFGNYFVAKPAFWRAWLALNEPLFEMAENPSDPLHAALNQPTSYEAPDGSGVHRKVFLQERTVSFLLTVDPRWKSRPYDPFGMGWSVTGFRNHRHEAYVSDALKRAWRDTAWPEYLAAYRHVRKTMFKT
jgi:hypothetical protein